MKAAAKAVASELAEAKSTPLRAPRVVVRVRPLAATGGHSADGKSVYKKLAKWHDGCVVLEDGHGQTEYKFADTILDTEATQDAVYEASAREITRAFVQQGYNALLFAYGQTGTGKTHTIFGPMESWTDVRHPDAGVFPRAVCEIFDTLIPVADSTSFVLTASAMEFYMCCCTDLLDNNKPCLIGADHAPLGLCTVPLTCPEDAIGFMERVRAARTTRSTQMNTAGNGHEGSSRSHCAMILTLRQVDRNSKMCMRTTLNIMDMAGAERPSSNGEGHESAIKAVMDYWRGAEVSVGGQGVIVNFELSALRTAVVQATAQHRKRKPLVNAKSLGTSFVEYASGCFSGSSLLAMIVTLSPAPSCGWETWFSCTYGEDLSQLRAPVRPQKPRLIQKVVAIAADTATKSAADLKKTPTSGPAAKYLQKRSVQARHDKQEADLFSSLLGMVGE
ncbi:hypothetical protein CYMTET_6992 [Cymbomonas tetramitiformis]|uniref:Kinesin motor domain-containing protein n=1 Tax=Cymbomonas tetramitiformis TaxID=36881 RepID=A0AAE0GWC2_9CHLO|nr:hypothetical protein CYMTET_6992 [Cymbomonas tetramitiformis]